MSPFRRGYERYGDDVWRCESCPAKSDSYRRLQAMLIPPFRSLRNLSIALWAGLLQHNPQFKGDEGQEILRSHITERSIVQIMESVRQAIRNALPKGGPAQLNATLKAAGAKSTAEDWDHLELWAIARQDLGLSTKDFAS